MGSPKTKAVLSFMLALGLKAQPTSPLVKYASHAQSGLPARVEADQ